MSSQVNFSKDFKPSFSDYEILALRYGWLEKSFQATKFLAKKSIYSEDFNCSNLVLAEIGWAINAENESKVSDTIKIPLIG